MKKLFFILLLIVVASFNARASDKLDKTVQCIGMFKTPRNEAKEYINDLVAPTDVKRRLLKQTFYDKNTREFVIEFLTLIDSLYISRFTEILDGKNITDYTTLGFKSHEEIRLLKESVIGKQIQILSIMPASDLTPEFKLDFRRILERIFDPHLSRSDLVKTSSRLDHVILNYSNNY